MLPQDHYVEMSGHRSGNISQMILQKGMISLVICSKAGYDMWSSWSITCIFLEEATFFEKLTATSQSKKFSF